MYSPVLIEMLAESRLAEVAAAAERRATAHKPAGVACGLVPLDQNEIRYKLTPGIFRALTGFREAVGALRTSRSRAVETH